MSEGMGLEASVHHPSHSHLHSLPPCGKTERARPLVPPGRYRAVCDSCPCHPVCTLGLRIWRPLGVFRRTEENTTDRRAVVCSCTPCHVHFPSAPCPDSIGFAAWRLGFQVLSMCALEIV